MTQAKRSAVVLTALALSCGLAHGRGVSPYLPLEQSPEIERRIEAALMLADVAVLTRPIPAAVVLDALPAVCDRDPVLCQEIRTYLGPFMRTAALTHASLAVAATSGQPTALPNRRGMNAQSAYEASASLYWQPSDYVLLTGGFIAYEDEVVPTGSVASLGFEYAQLDIGFRDHWFSPMTDGARLIGTQAQTMPSITLSNYTPLTSWKFRYEIFGAEMSESDQIGFEGGLTSGNPRLAGLHLSIEPVPGWSLGLNRLVQYGGGARDTSAGAFFDALFRPSKYDNTGTDEDFGNQLASFTSRFLFQGETPFAVYFEYAGEDTSFSDNLRLGNVAFSAGIYFPSLWQDLALTVEASEWQNGWYEHHIYGDGLRNEGNVIGHWSGDWRVPGDAVGGRSLTVEVAWSPNFGGDIQATYRTLENESYTSPDYETAHVLELRYSRAWNDFQVGIETEAGRDVFGDSYSRAGVFIRF
jgi:hypothetical protein